MCRQVHGYVHGQTCCTGLRYLNDSKKIITSVWTQQKGPSSYDIILPIILVDIPYNTR